MANLHHASVFTRPRGVRAASAATRWQRVRSICRHRQGAADRCAKRAQCRVHAKRGVRSAETMPIREAAVMVRHSLHVYVTVIEGG
jgi:hypothetical protein